MGGVSLNIGMAVFKIGSADGACSGVDVSRIVNDGKGVVVDSNIVGSLGVDVVGATVGVSTVGILPGIEVGAADRARLWVDVASGRAVINALGGKVSTGAVGFTIG